MTYPTNIPDQLTTRLLEVFKAEGKSILGVAETSGIPYTTLRRNLKNPDAFSVRQLIAIAVALDMTLDELMFGRVLVAA